MIDRFKFRAWYAKDKEMIYFDFDLLNDESRGFYQESIEHSDKMQCTGLKDRSGRLVYEGDILEANGTLEEVSFDEESSSFEPFCYRYCEKHGGYTDPEGMRVIGNKFENPELLNK